MRKIKRMEYFIFIVFFLVCLLVLFKNKRLKLVEIPTGWILIAFLSKLTAGIILWYIYTYYYSDKKISDIYKYFYDGHQLAIILKNNPSDFIQVITGNLPNEIQNIETFEKMKFWVKPNSYGIYNDNQTIILIASMLNLATNNNLILAILLMSISSFFATIIFYKSLHTEIQWKRLFFLLIFFLPSITLWTSGLLKETIIFCALTCFMFFGIRILSKINLISTFGFIISCFVLLVAKTYIFGFVLPSVACIVIIKVFNIRNVKISFATLYAIILIFIITWSLVHNPVTYNYKNKTEIEKSKEFDRVNQISYQQNVLGNNYNLLEMLRFKQADYKHEARLANAKSLINTKKMDGQLSNFFACIPFGLSNGFARPHILEVNNFMLIFPAFENLFILILLLLVFAFPRKLNSEQHLIVFSLGTFVVITFVFLGLLVPVLGNLIRYKAPLLPILFYCILMLIDKNKLLVQFAKFNRR